MMYAKGQGMPQNYVKAYMWWCLAAARGIAAATANRDDLAKLMTPVQVSEAHKLISEWKPKKTGE
jgi:TPR repeat protein